ncbi:MAG: ECF-type sigma factor [Gemmataceae bacterium]
MSAVTQLLDAAAAGDPRAAADLLPLVYAELRQLAADQLARERPGHTLQPTALVHEAYLRLVGDHPPAGWNGRGHFFGAAARAMRQILVDAARAKGADKRGGDRERVPLAAADRPTPDPPPAADLLALDAALARLAARDPAKARLVELRYFAGLSVADAADVLGISEATAKRPGVYARAGLCGQLTGGDNTPPDR